MGSLQPDQAHLRAPGVADLDTVRDRHDIGSAFTQTLFLGGKQIGLGDLQREPGKPGRLAVAAAGACALPDVEAEMMMVAAGGKERRALPLARRIEADRIAIELTRLREIADAQMHVADA